MQLPPVPMHDALSGLSIRRRSASVANRSGALRASRRSGPGCESRSKKWIGIAWWSRYDSRWQSLGLWSRKQLRLKGDPEVLSVEHSAVQEAATLLPRHLVSRA
jgi:hypothetical protein